MQKVILGAIVSLFGFVNPGLAQSVIVPDGTLGNERSVVVPNFNNAPIGIITNGAQRGQNLFHSFSQFNVGEGRAAYFFVPDVAIKNILTRITGNNRSEILGLLGTFQISGNTLAPSDANFFFMNPNGIIFGPSSSLDIGGSFTATTANAIGLGDRGVFSASQPQQSMLLAIAPGALLYEQIAAQGGRLSNAGNLSVGQDLTLAATNLDLQGELRSGRDLTLNAQDTVLIQDVGRPFLAISGNVLTIQGNQNVSIFSLFPLSRIQSFGNLNLISNDSIRGDIRFFSGGNFSVTTLQGAPGNFISSLGAVIYAYGDISFGDYEGAALKLQAAGDIQGRNIKITLPGIFILESDPDFSILQSQNAVIMRSGLTSVNTPNTSQNLGSTAFTGTLELPLGITINSIDTSDSNGGNGGDIILNAVNGNISTGIVSSGSSTFANTGGNGGNIIFTTSNGNITTTGKVDSSSDSGLSGLSTSDTGFGGRGGDISFNTINGNITTNTLFSGTFSISRVGGNGGNISLTATNGSIVTNGFVESGSVGLTRIAGNGGDISLMAMNGGIKVSNISSTVIDFNSGNAGNINLITKNGDIIAKKTVEARSISTAEGSGGNGGEIQFISTNGNIFTSDLSTFSISEFGNGGNIFLFAKDGSILSENLSNSSISTFSIAKKGTSGNGGNITLEAKNKVENLEILTLSSSGKSGDVQIKGLDDLSISNTRILTSKQLSILIPLSGEKIVLDIGKVGKSGDVIVASNGKLTFNNSRIESDTKGSDPAGNVIVTSPSLITFNNSQIVSDTSSTGQAGSINILGKQGITLTGSTSGLFAQTTGPGNAGNILLNTSNLTLQNGVELSASTNSRGNGGSITLSTDTFNLTEGSQVSARSIGSGNAGNITINTLGRFNANNGKIITEATSSGGDIKIFAGDIRLRGNSDITTNVTNGAGGSITLTANSILAFDDSDILSFAQQGQGGNITLNTQVFFGQNYRPGSPAPWDGNDRVDINASGTISGTISIPDVSFIQNGLNQLPKSAIDTEKLVSQTCIVRQNQPTGTFYILGKTNLPQRPGDLIPSNYSTQETQTQTANRPWQKGDPIVEPTGFYKLANGRVVMSRECDRSL